MSDSKKAHTILIATTIIAALNYSISKIVVPAYIQPFAVVALRGMISILVFTTWHRLWVRERIDRHDWPRIVLCALFGIVLNQLFFYKGLSLTSPINASLMMIMTPIMVLLVAVLLKQEQLTWLKIVGISLGMSGTACLLLLSAQGGFNGWMLGDLLVLINAVSWACFLITVKPLMKKYQPVTIMYLMFSLGFVVVLPLGWNELQAVAWQQLSWQAWTALAFILIFNTLISYYLNAAVMKYVNPSMAGSYIYLQPVVATAGAMALQMDSISITKVMLMILILVGVYLVNKEKKIPSER
ncbi:MAG: DMT family transporter [Cytophagaceae bacterium]|jgi:drug/metabolite transporter (DMT)-like permease|nr:DMT family transporter [Cytophagaceae bacterium]